MQEPFPYGIIAGREINNKNQTFVESSSSEPIDDIELQKNGEKITSNRNNMIQSQNDHIE